jgi:hypothetical protein
MQIVVDEGGGCEFTRSPQLLALLNDKDRKSIERMTDIRFDEQRQKYYIHFLKGPFAGKDLTVDERLPYSVAQRLNQGLRSAFWFFIQDYSPAERDYLYLRQDTMRVMFDTYENAVKFEVMFVEFLRDIGCSMNG